MYVIIYTDHRYSITGGTDSIRHAKFYLCVLTLLKCKDTSKEQSHPPINMADEPINILMWNDGQLCGCFKLFT